MNHTLTKQIKCVTSIIELNNKTVEAEIKTIHALTESSGS